MLNFELADTIQNPKFKIKENYGWITILNAEF
jgi:hypothetical protein